MVILLLFSSSVFAVGFRGWVIDNSEYKDVCYTVNDKTYKINITHNDYGFNCIVEEISDSRIRVICDSLYDGNGNGICHSDESCVGFGFYKENHTMILTYSEEFTWNPSSWSSITDDNGYMYSIYESGNWYLSTEIYDLTVSIEDGNTCPPPTIISTVPEYGSIYTEPSPITARLQVS